MPFFLLFIIIPIIEISLFISIGGAIGIWPTIFIVLMTALFGSIMIRLQGREAMARIRRALEGHGNIGKELASGAAIVIAGALMVTPGFFTDVVGFLLLVPFTRVLILEFMGKFIKFQTLHTNPHGSPRDPAAGFREPPRPNRGRNDDIIEGEIIDEEPRPDDKNRHE